MSIIDVMDIEYKGFDCNHAGDTDYLSNIDEGDLHD